MLVLDGSLDFPVSRGVDEADGKFFLGIVPVRIFGLDGVGTGGFFSVRESINSKISFLVVRDIHLADFFAVVGNLPFSAPPLGSLLGLLLVVDVHSTDSKGRSTPRFASWPAACCRCTFHRLQGPLRQMHQR